MTTQGFRSIVGLAEAKRHFQTAAAGSRLSHAYLITGEAGSGKRRIAGAFAMTLLCEKPIIADGAADACLECISCKKALGRNHPDVIYVTHEKPGLITVDEIRSQLIGTVGIKPYESRFKVYIVADADMMNPQAQNALLRTIEEPPEYAVILLLAASPETLLPTIRSRCVTVGLRPVSDREMRDYLNRELHVPDYEAGILVSFSQGNVGRALRAATDENFIIRRDKTLELMKRLHGMDTATIMEAVKMMKEDRDYISEILEFISMWFRDVLYFKATADVDGLIFGREISAIRAQASASSYPAIQEILSAVDRCTVRLNAHVSFEIALELMLSCIKENCNA